MVSFKLNCLECVSKWFASSWKVYFVGSTSIVFLSLNVTLITGALLEALLRTSFCIWVPNCLCAGGIELRRSLAVLASFRYLC